MKPSTLLLILAGWYLYSKSKTNITFTKELVCFANDNNRFPWPGPTCPYADIVANDVPYALDATGNYQPVVY